MSEAIEIEAEELPLQRECCVCRHVMQRGRLPASHGYCPQCFAAAMAELDALFPKTGVL